MVAITPEQLAKSGSEHGAQAALFCWASTQLIKRPQLNYLFAIPNGGARDKITAAKLKAEGVKSGVPDIMLAAPSSRDGIVWHGLFIELKVGKNKPTNEQEKWLRELSYQGYYTAVCNGWEHARDTIKLYLGME
jgi:hypothetical protein